MDLNMRRINRHFKRSHRFMKKIVKKARAEDVRERKDTRAFNRRQRRAMKRPKAATKAVMIEKMKAEDDAVIKAIPDVPAKWAVAEVMKDGAMTEHEKAQEARDIKDEAAQNAADMKSAKAARELSKMGRGQMASNFDQLMKDHVAMPETHAIVPSTKRHSTH